MSKAKQPQPPPLAPKCEVLDGEEQLRKLGHNHGFGHRNGPCPRCTHLLKKYGPRWGPRP